jgi:hypothetical protein
VIACLTLALVATACTASHITSPDSSRPTTNARQPNVPPLSVDAAATPTGWVPIDYGYAQLSVPTAWLVEYDVAGCGSTPPGLLVVQPPSGNVWCQGEIFVKPAVPPEPPRSIVTIGPIGLHVPVGSTRILIRDLTAYLVRSGTHSAERTYAVPSLGVAVTTRGSLGFRVLNTLTYSPRAAVLSASAGSTPKAWRWYTFDGLRFATPASWSSQRSDMLTDCRSFVALGQREVASYFRRQVIEPDRPVVYFDSDTSMYFGSCAGGVTQEMAPGDGVRVDAGSSDYPNARPSAHGRTVHLHGLTGDVSGSEPFDILLVRIEVPGRSMPIDFEIGLAGNGTTARTILYSLRAA